MAQSCGGEAVSMQGAVVKALVRLTAERPVVIFAAKNGELCERGGEGHEGREKSVRVTRGKWTHTRKKRYRYHEYYHWYL